MQPGALVALKLNYLVMVSKPLAFQLKPEQAFSALSGVGAARLQPGWVLLEPHDEVIVSSHGQVMKGVFLIPISM
jgi:hypothetical protein